MHLQSICLSRPCERTDQANVVHPTSVNHRHYLLSRKHQNQREEEASQQTKMRKMWLYDQQQSMQGLYFTLRPQRAKTKAADSIH